MRKLYFLVPGTQGSFACGGLWAEIKTFEIARKLCSAELVTYRQRETQFLFLDDVLKEKNLENAIFIISWGFEISKLAAKLKKQNVVYHAHSAGYNFNIPPSIPIVTVSKNTMGYWGQKSANSPIYYLPNQISDEFCNLNLNRDIDVLVQQRKSSNYLLKELIPALKQKCNVFVVDSYVEDLPKLFNRAKVYLYDSAEYWAKQGVSEGFGLQPMEAIACGCQVFSSVNGGLSDYLDPGFNCYKIAGYSKEYDIGRILKALDDSDLISVSEDLLAPHRTENILKRLQVILEELNYFFDCKKQAVSPIQSLTGWYIAKLRLENFFGKIVSKIRQF
ncbi:MAG: glycosyltransferase [Cyanobacteriota bacterium]|nr:glycosyltransferase [Cyanobacteriota bacterium]